MTLYEIDEQILECVDTETGEIIDTERLDYLQMERDQKIDGVACWIKELKAEADAIAAEIANLQARKSTAESKADRLKAYLEYALDGEKFKSARVSVTYRASEAVAIDDPEAIPEEFQRISVVPNKTDIKQAIKKGMEVPGAHLESRTSLIIK